MATLSDRGSSPCGQVVTARVQTLPFRQQLTQRPLSGPPNGPSDLMFTADNEKKKSHLK